VTDRSRSRGGIGVVGKPFRSRLPFAWQMLVWHVGVIILVVAVAFGLIAFLLDREFSESYQQRALEVARSVAADPLVAENAARDNPDQALSVYVERTRRTSGALFVVVTNRRGIRLTHPNPDLVGKPVSTDPSPVLAGREVANIERGTLGQSARGKTPVRDHTGQIVGEVSVGFAAGDIHRQIQQRLLLVTLFAAGALALGVTASVLLARRLSRLTLGLEPHQLAELMQEREAILRGVGEGVLALDAAERVTVCNDEAARLLSLTVTAGTPLEALDLPARLKSLLEAGERASNLVTVAGDRLLVANYREVRHDGRRLGGVLTVRDRTQLETLARELDAVRAVTNALRAQRHEFANRLHTIAGLLRTEHYAEATGYLEGVSTDMTTGIDAMADAVSDPYLQAFFAIKRAEAEEKGVRLCMDPESSVPGRVTQPVPVTTVVGNLVDNAVEAALAGSRRPASVEVSLLDDDGALVVQVTDSGDGIPPHLRERLFIEGVSTHGEGRGLGLALAGHAARSLDGRVHLASVGGEQHGAIFMALLPDVIQYDLISTGGGGVASINN
jgi:two-component system CitB family sensor kinase